MIHSVPPTHTNTHTHTNKNKNKTKKLLLLSQVSQAACALSWHSEPNAGKAGPVTYRRTDHHLSQTMVWAPVVQGWYMKNGQVICTPGPHLQLGGLVDGVRWTSHTTWWWGEKVTVPNQLGHVRYLNSLPCDHEPNVLPTAPHAQ